MKCREASLMIDLGQDETLWGRMSLYAHLTHCHACRCYLGLRQVLRKMARHRLQILQQDIQLNQFNERLLSQVREGL